MRHFVLWIFNNNFKFYYTSNSLILLNKFNFKYLSFVFYKFLLSFFSYLNKKKSKKNFKKLKVNTKSRVYDNKSGLFSNYKESFYKFFLNDMEFLNFFKIYSLRNNVVYLKSKFSKVRPFCKNIVYFSLIINVIVINELHSIYYNISINYGYLFQIIYASLIIYSVYLVLKKNKKG